VEWLREHRAPPNPTGWLVERGRWRALDLVNRENRRSGPPIDSVIHLVEDPAPTLEDALLERNRRRWIADALSHIPERDRKLLALVYYEGRSIRAPGRLLGWGKSSADSHHAEAMERLRVLVGERELLSPALVGLAAQAIVLHDRTPRVGGIANRLSAAAQDFADLAARSVGTVTRGADGTARRAAPLTNTGTAAISVGAGRALAQCGALAAICAALLLSPAGHGVEAALSPHHPAPTPARERRPADEPPPPTAAPAPAPTLVPSPRAVELSRSPGRTRLESRRRARALRRRRREKIARARRARKARASRVKRNENIEAAEQEAVEPTPEVEAPTPKPKSRRRKSKPLRPRRPAPKFEKSSATKSSK
jgi:hypothetical protein